MSFIDPLKNARIGIATTYGKPYYKFSSSLKILELQYDSILPENIKNYHGNLILTTVNESPKINPIPILYDDVFDFHPTIIRGLMLQKLSIGLEDELIIGVDPGSRIGLSISYFGREIERSLKSSVDDLVNHIIAVMAGLKAKRKIVKIGNGDMTIARHIGACLNLRFCSSFELEFVDERKTSPKIRNYNRRGKRDMIAAKCIAQREGYRRYILPLSITG